MCKDYKESNLKRKRAQSGVFADVFDDPKVRPAKKDGRSGRPGSRDYESKSKKVWRDRYEAARKDLKRAVEWYADAHKRGWYDDIGHEQLERNGWYAKRYREARANAKAHGAI